MLRIFVPFYFPQYIFSSSNLHKLSSLFHKFCSRVLILFAISDCIFYSVLTIFFEKEMENLSIWYFNNPHFERSEVKNFSWRIFQQTRTEKYRIKYPNTWFTDNIIINKRAENWGISDEKALRAFLTDAFKLNNFA